MVSEFRKKKYLYIFTFFDSDKNGTIDKKDFELAIIETAKYKGWAAGDEKYKSFENALMKVWNGMQSGADSNKDGKVTQEEWISMWDIYAKNPSAAAEWQEIYCKVSFDMVDANSDGVIDIEDFSADYITPELNKDEAVAAFKKIAKGKSTVSWSEFQELWKEYFCSEDVNAPGNCIFGKTSY